MENYEALIRENAELTARLALAEKWMRREVQSSIALVKREELQRSTRRHFENIFEEEGSEMMTKQVLSIFSDVLENAPKYTLERLIDAEIYWETLQKYPHMDALPIVLAYQKIFDAWIEERLIKDFRKSKKSMKLSQEPVSSLEKDIENILSKDYSLSVGRLYQIVTSFRNHEKPAEIVGNLLEYWSTKIPNILTLLISDEFFLPFAEIMEREVFSKKRHENKVSFVDAKSTREILV